MAPQTGRTQVFGPRFDVTRNAVEQVAFGTGPHACIGPHLAKLEMTALFRVLATRVRRFHIAQEIRNVNNTLRGFKKLIVAVEHRANLTRLRSEFRRDEVG
jgi:cytochrome P450